MCKPHFDEAAVQTGGGDVITQTQYVDMVSYMPYDICLKADRMSMAHSLELRVPFLDKKVLDVALQLPTDCRVTDEHSKYALRRAAAHLGFPQKVADMPKQPFITPLTVWLQTDLYYERIKEAFTSPAAHEFFNVDYLMKMLNDHRSADFSTQEGVPSSRGCASERVLLPVLVRGVLRRDVETVRPEDAGGVNGSARERVDARGLCGLIVGNGQIVLRPQCVHLHSGMRNGRGGFRGRLRYEEYARLRRAICPRR